MEKLPWNLYDKASPMEWSDKTGNETNGPVFMKPAESIALLDRQGNAHNQAYGPGADPTAAPGSAFAIEPENKGSDSVSANVDVKVNGVYHTVKATWNENHMRESGIEAGIQAWPNCRICPRVRMAKTANKWFWSPTRPMRQILNVWPCFKAWPRKKALM